jgi:hypothetical protein
MAERNGIQQVSIQDSFINVTASTTRTTKNAKHLH